MKKIMNKDFEFAWGALKKADQVFGSAIMEDKKLTMWQRFYRFFYLLPFGLEIFTAVYTLMVKYSDPEILFSTSCIVLLFICAIIQNSTFILKRQEYMKVFYWCKEIQYIDNYHIKKACKTIGKIIRAFVKAYIYVAIMGTWGLLLINYTRPGKDRYRPPSDIILPVEDQDHWYWFAINFTIHTSSNHFGVLFTFFHYGSFALVCTLFQAYLRIILDDVRDLKLILSIKGSKKPFNTLLGPIIDKYCKGNE